MRKTRTHSILAYMGNKRVGPVSLLSDSRTRVDGVRSNLRSTSLGRCMNEAGKSVRTRAFKSNYVRLELRNKRVADPLAALPAKPDRNAIKAKIESVDGKVRACARKHNQEGADEVFYFRVDGPTGKVQSVRATYRSKPFRRCAESIYKRLVFPKTRQADVKYTHRLRL